VAARRIGSERPSSIRTMSLAAQVACAAQSGPEIGACRSALEDVLRRGNM
jgi:hypothetical protein